MRFADDICVKKKKKTFLPAAARWRRIESDIFTYKKSLVGFKSVWSDIASVGRYMNVLHEWRDVHLFKKKKKTRYKVYFSFIGIMAACFFPSVGHMTSVTFLSHHNIKLFYYTSFKWQCPVNSNTLHFGPPDFQMNPHCFLLLVFSLV